MIRSKRLSVFVPLALFNLSRCPTLSILSLSYTIILLITFIFDFHVLPNLSYSRETFLFFWYNIQYRMNLNVFNTPVKLKLFESPAFPGVTDFNYESTPFQWIIETEITPVENVCALSSYQITGVF